jgi:hypothetical protein
MLAPVRESTKYLQRQLRTIRRQGQFGAYLLEMMGLLDTLARDIHLLVGQIKLRVTDR